MLLLSDTPGAGRRTTALAALAAPLLVLGLLAGLVSTAAATGPHRSTTERAAALTPTERAGRLVTAVNRGQRAEAQRWATPSVVTAMLDHKRRRSIVYGRVTSCSVFNGITYCSVALRRDGRAAGSSTLQGRTQAATGFRFFRFNPGGS